MRARSLSHWNIREVPKLAFFFKGTSKLGGLLPAALGHFPSVLGSSVLFPQLCEALVFLTKPLLAFRLASSPLVAVACCFIPKLCLTLVTPWTAARQASLSPGVCSNSFLLRRRQWQPTPILAPGKSHGWRSLIGCSPWSAESRTQLSGFTFTFPFTHWRRK